MKLSKNFSLSELVHPDIIAKVGNRSADFLHPMAVGTLQALRDEFGSITVNGMFNGQVFKDSGLRLPHGHVGANLSSQKFGCGFDLKFSNRKPIEVQNHIILNQSDYPYITRIENALVTKTWLHLEIGERTNSIKVFNP